MPSSSGGPPSAWRVRDRAIPLDRPLIAGILNVTPDSFSDGGRYLAPDAAVDRARALVEDGADLIDVGAESTRPGAEPVPEEEEWARLRPVLERLDDLAVPISVDTTKTTVARRALDLGVAVINVVSGLDPAPGLLELAASEDAGLVLMHMRGTPRTMQEDTTYGDVVAEVRDALAAARDAAAAAGCDAQRVALDPGIGFGKSVEGNLELIARLDEIASLGGPVWIGPSRKAFLGHILGAGPAERTAGTVAACLAARRAGAHVFRVHDPRPVRDAFEVEGAIERRRGMHREAAGSPAGGGSG